MFFYIRIDLVRLKIRIIAVHLFASVFPIKNFFNIASSHYTPNYIYYSNASMRKISNCYPNGKLINLSAKYNMFHVIRFDIIIN